MVTRYSSICKKEHTVAIPLAKPILSREMETAAVDALRNERFVLGESVLKFEDEFAEYCEVDFAVSTSSGTAALSIALTALNIKQGASVITTPASFVATANSVLHSGCVPKFADIDLATYNQRARLDPERLEADVETGTRAVIPVHLHGFPAEVGSMKEVAEKKGIAVVEDTCQAHGALYKNRKVGEARALKRGKRIGEHETGKRRVGENVHIR